MDCGCGGNGSWTPVSEEGPTSVRPADGAVGALAPGYFSTWAGDAAVPAQPEPVAAEQPSE